MLDEVLRSLGDTWLTGKGPNHNTKNLKILFNGQITVFKSSTQKRVHFLLQQIS